MILVDGVRYELTTPKNEAVLEKAIQSNCEHIFGPDSFYFDIKSKLKSKAGVVSIPDGYVIYFTSVKKARWAIIEVELASHPVYEHVVPQLSKFNRGIEDGSTKRKLVEVLYGIFDEDEVLKAKLKQRIKSGEVYKFISDLISEKPLIVVAIDQRTEQLDEALHDIRGDVRVVEFKIFRREDIYDYVNAYLFEPVLRAPNPRQIDVGVSTLFGTQHPGSRDDSDRMVRGPHKKPHCKLKVGLQLRNKYKGREFTAEVLEGNRVKFQNKIYQSVSGAAVAAIRSTGSMRGTEDGWRWWKYVEPDTGEEKLLDELRK